MTILKPGNALLDKHSMVCTARLLAAIHEYATDSTLLTVVKDYPDIIRAQMHLLLQEFYRLESLAVDKEFGEAKAG